MKEALPSLWTLARVGDIASVDIGFAFKSAQYVKSGIRLLRGENIEPGSLRWTDTRYWSEDEIEEFKHLLVSPGDVILAMDRPVVSAGLKLARARATDCPCLLVQRVARLQGWEGTTDFLNYALASPAFIKHVLVGGQTGTQLPHISGKRIESFDFPLPPKREQQRIVDAIESYSSRLDDAVATLERVERNLKRYRASVLKAAVEGRLVPTEAALAKQESRPYEPASVLLERILTERRRRWSESGKKSKYEEPLLPDTTNLPDLPECWCWATVEQLTLEDRPICYGVLKAGPHVDGGIPLVRVTDIVNNDLRISSLKRCSPEREVKFARARLRSGDLIVSKDGTIGKVAIVPPELDGANVTQHVLRVAVSPLLQLEYMRRVLEAPTAQAWMKGETRGVALQGINVEDFRRLPIPLPPASEQIRICGILERTLSVVQVSELQIAQTLMRASRLRQSVLKWAFEGRLADQDANDEPASALLERIKAERGRSEAVTEAVPPRAAQKKQVGA